jgi:hypothetical protein
MSLSQEDGYTSAFDLVLPIQCFVLLELLIELYVLI